MGTSPRPERHHEPPARIDAVVLGESALARLRGGRPCNVLLLADADAADAMVELVRAMHGAAVVPVVLAAGQPGQSGMALRLPGATGDATSPPLPGGDAARGPLDAVFAAIAEGVLVTDAHGRITQANAALLRITGHAEAEVLGRDLDLLWSPKTDAGARRRLRECLDRGQGFAEVVASQRKGGAVFWNQFSLTPVFAESGELVQFVAVVRDVTEWQLLQDQFLHAQKMEAIDQLSGGVAHDFNNLLTIITGNIELLEDAGRVTPDIADRIHEISQAADRAVALTRQLLQFGRKPFRNERVLDLAEVVDSMGNMLRRIVGDGIRIEVRHQLRPAWVRVDQGRIEQVLMNLCANARDAMPDGGVLRIAVEPASTADIAGRGRTSGPAADFLDPGACVQLSVTDTGCGIPDEHKSRLFQPFFTTKGVGKGTGLGLATVGRVAREHGGACAVESEVGKGTRVLVWLPAVDATAVATESAAASAGDGSSGG